jgi:hypothetical protein
MNLKTWYLTPARYENHAFIKYSNANLDDIANAVSSIDIDLAVTTDLDITETVQKHLYFRAKQDCFQSFIEPKSSFTTLRPAWCGDQFEGSENIDKATSLCY